jgi:hypothetical protein
MRVMTWNMGRNSGYESVHDEAWRYVVEHADIALLQETVPPPWIVDDRELAAVKAWPTRAWSTAIVTRSDSRETWVPRCLGRLVRWPRSHIPARSTSSSVASRTGYRLSTDAGAQASDTDSPSSAIQ